MSDLAVKVAAALIVAAVLGLARWIRALYRRFAVLERDVNRSLDFLRRVVWLFQRYDRGNPASLDQLKHEVDGLREAVWQRRRAGGWEPR